MDLPDGLFRGELNHHMSLANFEHQILSLPESDRIHLIEILWESLDTDDVRQRGHNWVAESERRLDAVATGQLPLLDANQVFGELRGALGTSTLTQDRAGQEYHSTR